MKKIISLLLFLVYFVAHGQEPTQLTAFLSYNSARINSGDVIEIHELKNIKINKGQDTTEYEIQFIIVPFEGTLLSFSKNQDEIESMDIIELLEIGNISIDRIKHIVLNARRNEYSPTIDSEYIFTRKLENAQDFFNEFTLYASIGDKESSIWCIGEAIKLDSSNLLYLNAQAQLYFEMGEMTMSQEKFLKILNLQPNYTSLSYLALISLNLGDYIKAKSLAERSLKFASNDLEMSTGYLNMADAYAKTYEFSSAYSAYRKAIELNPRNINALNNITTVLDEVNKSNEKVDYFKQILSIDSSFYLVHINIGFQYLNEEKFELALEEFNSVIRIDSNQAIAHSNKAYTLMKLGRLDNALGTIEKSLQLDQNNSYAHRNKALILLELGKPESACEALNRAIELNFTQQYGEEVILLKNKNCE